jgi:hypothetical protein
MDEKIIVNGIEYKRIGDRLVDESKIWSEETKHPDGQVDCTVHVPYLQIQGKLPNQ